MRKNLIQKAEKGTTGLFEIPGDWFPGSVPENFTQAEAVYLDSSWGFDAFSGSRPDAMEMGYASSCYDRATFLVSGDGRLKVGEYTILNGCTIICTRQVRIGSYVMIAWGAVVTDNYIGSELEVPARSSGMQNVPHTERREMPFSSALPVIIEDNVWIGFESVILPGTTIGRGSVIGCKAVVQGSIPEYSVVVGNPARIIRKLEPTDQMNRNIV